MPTQRKRHTVTETDEVGDVLRRVEAATGERADLGELVLLGGKEKLLRTQLQHEANVQRGVLRRRLVERTRTGEGIDLDAVSDVHESGWTHG